MLLSDVTYGELICYIHSKFPDYTYEQIYTEIKNAMARNDILFSVDKNKIINGFVIAETDHKTNNVHVKFISGDIRLFINEFLKLRPGYKLTGRRHGIIRSYNINTLCKKFSITT